MVSSSSSSDFKHFEVVVSCPVDHYFYNRKSTNLSLKAQKKITKEWKILEESLPRGSIYVRAYESRLDLMRAVIVGAKGTPYHDGLFFFDFRFPANYPNSPPEVKHRSHGMSINPNLYINGEVCLSLLNTWRGSGCEKWDPSKSTVLQVLVSIQGLVLNENPFFNEPMVQIFLGKVHEFHSRNYNERVFALSCKSALFLLRKRPQDFDEFVVSHYRDRSSTILEACRAYSSGTVRVGFYGSTTSGGAVDDVSDRFKKKVRELYNLLVEAFVENSIEVSQDLVEFGVKLDDDNNEEKEEEQGCGIIEWFRSFFKLKKF